MVEERCKPKAKELKIVINDMMYEMYKNYYCIKMKNKRKLEKKEIKKRRC